MKNKFLKFFALALLLIGLFISGSGIARAQVGFSPANFFKRVGQKVSMQTTSWILSVNSYLNFGNTDGAAGHGFRDNSGDIQVKNSGGSWNNVLSDNYSGDISIDGDLDMNGNDITNINDFGSADNRPARVYADIFDGNYMNVNFGAINYGFVLNASSSPAAGDMYYKMTAPWLAKDPTLLWDDSEARFDLNYPLNIQGAATTTDLTVTNSANLLTLDVSGTGTINGSLALGNNTTSTSTIGQIFSGGTGYQLYSGLGWNWGTSTDSPFLMNLSPAGNLKISGNGVFGGYLGIGQNVPNAAIDASSSVADLLRLSNASGRVLTVLNSGNLGVGTSSPAYKLDVFGNARVDGVLTANSLVGALTGNASTASALAANGTNCSAGSYALGVDASGNSEGCTTAYTAAGTHTGLVQSTAAGNSYFTGGNLGIGTTAPGAKLDIQGDVALVTNGIGSGNSGLVLNGNNTRSSAPSNDVSSYIINSNATGGSYPYNGVGNLVLQPRTSVARDIVFMTGNTTPAVQMVIASTGNVGIGTSSPSSKLEVNGGDIKVTGGSFIDDGQTLTVPDYVFEPNYSLKSLPEVENYVKENKHLEGFPDMTDKAAWAKMSLQDRDMKLLEKIEELTLYTIEQDKKIKELENRQSWLERFVNSINQFFIPMFKCQK